MKKPFAVLAAVVILASFAAPAFLFAQGGSGTTGSGGGTGSTGSGGGTGTTGSPGFSIKISNPFKVGDNLIDIAKAIVDNIILPIGGVLCVLAFIWAGFQYVVAQGDSGKIKNAHRTLLNASIGTALLLGSWTIANVIGSTISQLTTTP